LKLARRLLEEKSKQVQLLSQQLAVSEHRSLTVAGDSAKHQRGEIEAKRKLWSKETTLLRQSVALRNSNSLLQSYVSRETDQERRRNMGRKELEAEIDRLEEDFELQVIALTNARLKLEETCTAREADYQRKSVELDEQYTSHFADLTATNTAITEKMTSLEQQIATQAHDIDVLQNKYNAANNDLQQRSQELSDETKKSRRLLGVLESVSTNHRSPGARAPYEGGSVCDSTAHRQLDQCKEELAETTAQLAHAIAEIDRQRQAGAATSHSSSELWNSVQSLQHQLALARGEVKSKSAALEAGAVEQGRLEGALVLETNRRIHLESMLADSDRLVSALREDLAAAEAKVVSVIKAVEDGELEGRQTWRDVDVNDENDENDGNDGEDTERVSEEMQPTAETAPPPAGKDLAAEHAEQTRMLRSSISLLESAMDMQNAELNDLRSKHENCREIIETAEEKQHTQQSLLDMVYEENEKLKASLSAAQAEWQLSDAVLATDLRDSRQRLSASRAELAAATGQLSSVERKLHTAEAAVGELERQRDDRWRESISQQSKQYLSDLQGQIQALVTDNRRLRKEVAASHSDSSSASR
jgi:predicted  nucleic acid-binding Zn-ribbon protein